MVAAVQLRSRDNKMTTVRRPENHWSSAIAEMARRRGRNDDAKQRYCCCCSTNATSNNVTLPCCHRQETYSLCLFSERNIIRRLALSLVQWEYPLTVTDQNTEYILIYRLGLQHLSEFTFSNSQLIECICKHSLLVQYCGWLIGENGALCQSCSASPNRHQTVQYNETQIYTQTTQQNKKNITQKINKTETKF